MFYIPTVIDKNLKGDRYLDIFSKMLKERVIFLNGPIDDSVSMLIVSQLMFLDSESNKDIILYINSPGGVVSSGLSIYDTIQFINSEVITICTGQAASMGAVILAAGSKGKRYSFPNSRIMIHQPLGYAQGQATDVEIHAREMMTIKRILSEILSVHTLNSIEKIFKDTERDNFMDCKKSLEYGIIDNVIYKK
ncbi:ATP-dependent Clp protease proteolytic subunit [Candidatus Carsonella ruddii]|uniref:ATP-dependent Clp protease proteolytic subunit n=2 Tax=cellular organisms TaxID=131567 RepID=A0AAJ6FLL0_CARRU|nr:ATP-dependent Clp protease proteolytic subunit [Candidatus Carsonella ruddii]WGS66753.1 ATP-dependent Clp protease proteolytic subunit [Candidatus Carsonella ruddii]WGS66947.1 ATP-dependent Clp protease proteolytic subunit [Candidatus Carsonella ruddii]WGS67138.1 ATP-dependent Clp protease proteolytic subunit [Candidatus Carsonella ruddii]WGS67330.1 ATP-dependent Clp protease proteolytic subunit [Candidatus Carsonella ruddii]WMC18349.1 MAG: ATP-dependent Clp protease proteolytic subunit [Ca